MAARASPCSPETSRPLHGSPCRAGHGLRDRRVFALAVPNIISNLSTPLLGIVDNVVVGHLPDSAALAGVSLSLAVLNPLLFAFVFLRKSTVGLAGQALGAGDVAEARAVAWRAVLLGLACGGLVLALRPLFRAALPHLGGDAATAAAAAAYYDARLLGAPAALANFSLQGWLLGVQRSREALAANLVLNAGNIALCLLLGVWCGLGVRGVGWATAAANYVAMAYGLWRVRRLTRDGEPLGAGPPLSWRQLARAAELRRLVALNSVIFCRSLCITGMLAAFTVRSARFGRAVLAADSLLMQLQSVLSFGTDGFANAAEAIVGEAVGARDVRALRRGARSAVRGGAALALIFTALYVGAGRWLVRGFTSHAEILTVADQYLPWQWAAPLLSVWAYLMDGLFVGATLPGPMRDSMLLATTVFVLLALLPWGNDGLWAAWFAHLLTRGLVLGAMYPRIEALCAREPALLEKDSGSI